MGYKMKESVMGCKLNIFDFAVTGKVLKQHKVIRGVSKPLVAPNVGVPIVTLKNATHASV